MQSNIVNVILVMAVATAITRLLPLMLPKKYYDSTWLKELNQFFPMLILTLLVIYSVRTANWNLKEITSTAFAYAELISMLSTVVVYQLTRNLFLSIGLSTAIYVLLKAFLM